ncbi:MAG: hypothetical protein K0Q50_535 [Vampirovibrio sp.]|jgi:hypothetical protein|nr:hypothetical protein [Vampirovibrio sp.]
MSLKNHLSVSVESEGTLVPVALEVHDMLGVLQSLDSGLWNPLNLLDSRHPANLSRSLRLSQ